MQGPYIKERSLEEQGSAGSDTSGDTCGAFRNGYPVPLSEASSPSTIGHKLGPDGKCNPCVFNLSKRGCHQGADCEYCHAHMATEARIPHRPRKETRLKAKRSLDQALAQNQADSELPKAYFADVDADGGDGGADDDDDAGDGGGGGGGSGSGSGGERGDVVNECCGAGADAGAGAGAGADELPVLVRVPFRLGQMQN
eukprot:s4550_g11.t1